MDEETKQDIENLSRKVSLLEDEVKSINALLRSDDKNEFERKIMNKPVSLELQIFSLPRLSQTYHR